MRLEGGGGLWLKFMECHYRLLLERAKVKADDFPM